MYYEELKAYINDHQLDEMLFKIKGTKNLNDERKRYLDLLETAYHKFGDGDYHFISSPGRSEIGGNHTDHQHGHVVAAALDLDNVCIVKASDDELCVFEDEKFAPCEVDLSDLEIVEKEKNSSAALVRGVAAKLDSEGYKVSGFRAYCDSEVLIGSGISSSACFEVMLVEIFNSLFNEGKIDPIKRAIVGQYAENVYFGKPCGLMDQLSISAGGFSAIDFADPNNPKIDNYDFRFDDYGYDLVLVDTNGDHSGLSNEYAAITKEIKLVADQLGVEVLRDGDRGYFFSHIKEIREKVNNDRAVLRAYHFFMEDERAVKEKEAIANNDIDGLIELMKDSGASSYMYLQNVYPASRADSQSLAMGLAMSEYILGKRGAIRVHGGGFEGTIQAVVPHGSLENYKTVLSSVFGSESIMVLKIRPFGTATLV